MLSESLLHRVSKPLGKEVIALPMEAWVDMSQKEGLISIQAGVQLSPTSMYVARMEYQDLQPCTAVLGIDNSA